MAIPGNVHVSGCEADLCEADPECYQLGKQRLGLSANADVVVIEDSPAGIKAGKAAGCKVIALATTHSLAQICEQSPDWIVRDLRSVNHIKDEAGTMEKVMLEVSNTLIAP